MRNHAPRRADRARYGKSRQPAGEMDRCGARQTEQVHTGFSAGYSDQGKVSKRGLPMTQHQQSEPPSWLRPPLFMVGQDRRGNWVVQDQKGMRGGLFVNREAALRYVRSENGFIPQAVVMVSGGVE